MSEFHYTSDHLIHESESVEMIAWLKTYSFSLDNVEPYGSTEDLKPIEEMVLASRLVGLGESSHGNREYAQLRHKISRHLIENQNFQGIIYETPEEPAKYLDEYVKGGNGDIHELVSNMGYKWTTRTEEMVELIEWIRQYNLNNNKEISFLGCDIAIEDDRRKVFDDKRDAAMAENCQNILSNIGSDSRMVVMAHNYHLAKQKERAIKRMGAFLEQDLGNAYSNFALIANQGSFNAWTADPTINNVVTSVTLPPAPIGSYEHLLTQIGDLPRVVDLRGVHSDPKFASWETKEFFMRDFGAGVDEEMHNYSDGTYYPRMNLAEEFDGAIILDKVSPSIIF